MQRRRERQRAFQMQMLFVCLPVSSSVPFLPGVFVACWCCILAETLNSSVHGLLKLLRLLLQQKVWICVNYKKLCLQSNNLIYPTITACIRSAKFRHSPFPECVQVSFGREEASDCEDERCICKIRRLLPPPPPPPRKERMKDDRLFKFFATEKKPWKDGGMQKMSNSISEAMYK